MMLRRPLCFTDIHWGFYSDSERHNKDCTDYIDWMISQYYEQKCDSLMFLGDWYHNQAHVEWSTLWASEQAITKLDSLNVPIYWMIGNHDLYHKHTRAIHSHPSLHRSRNICVVNDLTTVDDMLLCPYLMGAEYNAVANAKSDYVFGHFSMAGFVVNENWEMTEAENGLNPNLFSPKGIYSGHFHKRQRKTNENGTEIVYIGNCFPHTHNDDGDRERGCMVFDRDELLFLNWADAPTYDKVPLSDLIKTIENDQLTVQYGPRSTVIVTNDVQLDDPDLTDLNDWLRQQGFRSIKIEPPEIEEQEGEVAPIPAPRENITKYFYTGLNLVDTQGSKYSVPRLQTLFNDAMGKHDRGDAI